MRQLVVAAIAAGIALGTAPSAAALPNQDDPILCISSAYRGAAAHANCAATPNTTGRHGRHTNDALVQNFYPLAMPKLSPPVVPTAQGPQCRVLDAPLKAC